MGHPLTLVLTDANPHPTPDYRAGSTAGPHRPRALGYGLTARTLLLLAAGVLAAIPAFFHPHRIWIMLAWDGFILLLAVADALTLPAPGTLRVTRQFLTSPRLGEETPVELTLQTETGRILRVTLTDALEASLAPTPTPRTLTAYPRDAVRTTLTPIPGRRGEIALGDIFLRYRTPLGFAERWAFAPTRQTIRVFPAMDEEGSSDELYLMRARQIELQKRRLRQRGLGREFETLRDYQRGDELRNISWTATARRDKLIARQFTTERSQQVWIVLDAGRLARTAFELRRRVPTLAGESEAERAESLTLTVTQLDQATTAAVMLARAVAGSGDRFALLGYGRRVQAQLTPGTGPAHLRLLIDQLSQLRAEPAEADHLHAASRLKQLQRRRGLIVWITEIADSAGRPEIVAAVAELSRRHLVLLVLLHHPELDALAASPSTNPDGMYRTAAAREMLSRRRETIARLRRQGVLVVEASPAEIGLKTINSYLDIKSKGLI